MCKRLGIMNVLSILQFPFLKEWIAYSDFHILLGLLYGVKICKIMNVDGKLSNRE